MLDAQPGNIGAMRNLAILYRDMGDIENALEYAEQAVALTPETNVEEIKNQRNLAAQLYEQAGIDRPSVGPI